MIPMRQPIETSASPSSGERCLAPVPPERVMRMRHEVYGWLESALCDDPRLTLASVLADCLQERATLWLFVDAEGPSAALVTRIIEYEGGRSLEIQLCGGGALWRNLPLLGELEDYARAAGCAFAQVCGRPGWERALPEYRRTGVQLLKEL